MLAGRRGLVVGVSPGNLGDSCARRLREFGADVITASRRDGADLQLDLDDEPSVVAAFAKLDRLDFLVHCVVEVPDGLLQRPFVDVTREEFSRVLAIGAWSLVSLCHHALPLLRQGTSPRVVAISSECGHRYTPRYHVAGVAKAALDATVLYLAGELGPDGIGVNAVSPPFIATTGAVAAVGAEAAQATRRHQARKALTREPVEPDHVANVVAWLCSAHAAQVTGEIVRVDGGYARAYL